MSKVVKQNADTEFLQTACREVWWTCSKLPPGKQVSAINKKEMVLPTEGETAGYSISKRIFASKHPAIQGVNEAFRKIDILRDEYTIVKSASATSDEGRFQVEPGRRIIRIADIEEFEEKFKEIKQELEIAVQVVASCVNNEAVFDGKTVASIKQMDKERLQKTFDPKDYPAPEDLVKSIRITMPQYGTLTVDKLLPDAVVKRECDRINQELGDTVALAADRVASDLLDSLTSLARSLSKKVLLDPLPGDPWRDKLIQCYPVEVVNVLETRDDRSIPKGKIRLELSWKQANNDELGQTITVRAVSEIMTKEDYEAFLRPRETGDRKALRTSAIANVQQSLDCLSRVQAMLGEGGKQIETHLAAVKSTLYSCSKQGTAADIARELKNNEPISVMLRQALTESITEISESVEKVVSTRRKLVL
jgi:hypothetical protein